MTPFEQILLGSAVLMTFWLLVNTPQHSPEYIFLNTTLLCAAAFLALATV